MWPEGVEWSGKTRKVLTRWIEQPRVMVDLGRKLLNELRDELVVHVGRDYRGDDRRQGGQRDAKKVRLE